jgi:Flp pilus assembly protein TadD
MFWLMIILIIVIIVIASFALPEFKEFALHFGKGFLKWSAIVLIIMAVFVFFYVSYEKKQQEERKQEELRQEQIKQENLKQEKLKQKEQEKIEQEKFQAIQYQRNKSEAELQVCTSNCIASINRKNSKVTSCIDECTQYAYSSCPSMEQDASHYTEQGYYYYSKGDYNNATSNYTRAIRLKPNNVHAYAYRGSAHFKLGNYQLAIIDYNEYIRLKPTDINAYNNRGNAYFHLGNEDFACRDFKKACALANGEHLACGNLDRARAANHCR